MSASNFDNPRVSHPALPTFAELARSFCSVVENRAATAVLEFQSEVQRLVALLYAAGVQLPPTDILYNDDEDDDGEDFAGSRADSAPDPDRLNADSWHRLFADLEAIFGENTHYREIFDPYPASSEEPPVVGSVADDIADIYQDVRSGLLKWDRGESGPALWEWRFHFEVHWGEHATSIIRALHSRAAFHGAAWPSVAHD